MERLPVFDEVEKPRVNGQISNENENIDIIGSTVSSFYIGGYHCFAHRSTKLSLKPCGVAYPNLTELRTKIKRYFF